MPRHSDASCPRRPRALTLTQDRLPTVVGRRFPLHGAGVLAHVADLGGRGSVWHVLMGKRDHVSYVCPAQGRTTWLTPFSSPPQPVPVICSHRCQSQSNLESTTSPSTILPLTAPHCPFSPHVPAPVGYIHLTPPSPPEHGDCPMPVSHRERSVSQTVTLYTPASPSSKAPLRHKKVPVITQSLPLPNSEYPCDNCWVTK